MLGMFERPFFVFCFLLHSNFSSAIPQNDFRTVRFTLDHTVNICSTLELTSSGSSPYPFQLAPEHSQTSTVSLFQQFTNSNVSHIPLLWFTHIPSMTGSIMASLIMFKSPHNYIKKTPLSTCIYPQ